MRSTVRSASLPAPSPLTLPPRSLTTTLAPCFASSRAWPRPMPCPAPVTIAILPSNNAIGVSVLSQGVLPLKSTQKCVDLRGKRSGLRVAVAELELHDLAGGVARERVDDLELLRQLLLHQPALEEVGAQLVERGRLGGVGWDDHGTGPFPRAFVGQADDGHVGHLRMSEQIV